MRTLQDAGRTAFSLFCDDLRQEVGGKQTLVGVYSGAQVEINQAPPLILPRMCVVTHIFTPLTSPFKRLAIDARWNGAVLQRVEPEVNWLAEIQKMKGPPDAKVWNVQAALVLQPFAVSEAGVLRMYVTMDNEEFESNGLNFHFNLPSQQVATTF
ncbi:hypothetical protein JJB11_16115 [Ramlibacter ginsenosidimutans]|uniref:Uncharacterized protein n=1 Tax=Ramlibacter ginsenosidimutans TaxID=502333 RepID=A0A934WNG5_9BURK|nr:hypothetical protein [Ramlibacter ginsenosidimutans]MBK6007625.1 hypothetical protein [Ramlibacter ginsenosidimutans]